MKVRTIITSCMTFLVSLLHYDLWMSEISFVCTMLDLFLTRHNVRFHNLVDFICSIILLVLWIFWKWMATHSCGIHKYQCSVPSRTHDPWMHIFFVAPSVQFVTEWLIFCSPSFCIWPFVKTNIRVTCYYFFKGICCCTLHWPGVYSSRIAVSLSTD
jgi:hypothetical protein